MHRKSAFSSTWTGLAAFGIVTATYLVDLELPHGFAGAMPYVLAVVLGLWAPSRRFALMVAAITTVLSALAVPLKPPTSIPDWMIIFNRGVAILALWLIALGVYRYRLVQDRARDIATRTQVILDTTVDALVTVDQNGQIELFNRAAEKMFGWQQAEIVGKSVSLLMPTPQREKHKDYIRSYCSGTQGETFWGREVTAVRRDGTVFPIDLSVSRVPLEGQCLFTASMRDITERQRAEHEREELIENLEKKNQELEGFTYTVSHDLKTPIVTIKGFLRTLERSAREGKFERLRSDIERIEGAADRMRLMLDELLDLSRVGRVTSPPVDIAFADLARDCVEAMAGTLAERRVQVEIQDDLPTVRGDRVRLLEVLQNLIENAIKFSVGVPHPKIRIGTRKEDSGETVLTVEDNGIGVEPRYHEKIFGLFEKLDRKQPGTGVGLALVKRIIEVHGGRVWVESEGQGKGACFCFTLPTPGAATSLRKAAE